MKLKDKIAEITRSLVYHGRHFSPSRDMVVLRKANEALLSLCKGTGQEGKEVRWKV